MAGNGDPTMREGIAIHMYAANKSMENKAFCNNDGDFLILPQQGRIDVQTEFGRSVLLLSAWACFLGRLVDAVWRFITFCRLMVRPGELLVIQRGMRFRVAFPDGPSRGCTLLFLFFLTPFRFLLGTNRHHSHADANTFAQISKKSTARTTNYPP